MCEICKTINNIDKIIKADEEQFKQDLKEKGYLEIDFTMSQINKLEDMVYKLLRQQAIFYINGIDNYVSKASVGDILNYMRGTLFAKDDFISKFGKQFEKFFNFTTEKLTNAYIKIIDGDLFFNTFTSRTTDWIKNWSGELANILHLDSIETIESILTEGIEEGKGIKDISRDLKDSFGFSRTRARRIATTEVLTAHSRAAFESAVQNPSVDRVTWRHSGLRGIKPRPDHVAIDGVTIPVGDYFHVGTELAQYPRDTNLSAKERVNCHCLLQQVVNDSTLGLSLEERQRLQSEAIQNDNRIYNRRRRR